MSKEIKDLTNKEIVEDLDYYTVQLNFKSPPHLDEMFKILYKYIVELLKRFDSDHTLEPKEPRLEI